MKSSKLFLSSLLAAATMSAAPAFAEDYTVTGAFTGGQSDDNLTGTIDETGQTITLSSGDTLTFSGATSGYFPKWGGGDRTVAANIVISDRGSITINNGDSGSYMIFSGSVSGAGDFIVNANNAPAKGQDFIFTGNLTAFTGDFSRPVANFDASGTDSYNNNNTGILQFGGTVSNGGIGAGTAYVASAVADTAGVVHNISGTNQSTITTTSVLRYNYTGSANEGVTALGIDNSSISARYLDFCGGANYTVSSTVTGNNATAANNTLKISAGTTTFTGAVSNFGNVTIASGATLAVGATGSLNLSGATVTLGSSIQNTGVVTLSDTSVVEVGALNTLFNTSQTGAQNFSGVQFVIATGTGSVSGLTASGIRVNGLTYANTTVAEDGKSVSVSGNVYNIALGDSASISDVSSAGTFDYVNVLGTLTGLGSTSSTTPIYGTGTVCVDTGELQYHGMTFLETFEGVLDISGTGEVKLGDVAGSKLAKVSKVTVSTDGTLSFWRGTFSKAVELSGGTLKSSGGNIGFSGSVTVTSASTIDSGANTITISGAVSGAGKTLTKIGTGTLELSNNTLSLGELVVSAGTVQVKNTAETSGRDKRLTKVTLANGTTLQQYSGAQADAATGIGELALSGATATLETANFQGYWKVNKLDIGEQTSAILNLKSSHSASLYSIFEFGVSGSDSGNFNGILNVTSTASTGANGNRSVAVVLSNGSIASQAVLNFSSITSDTGNLALGVNDACVAVAGLKSAESLGSRVFVYSGALGTKISGDVIPAGDSTTRTLVINTAEGGDYSFNGKILANLNLEKTGLGTQTLAGASTAFNGSVKVSGGVLALADASAIGSGNAVRIDGGQLKVGNGTTAVSLNEAAYTIVLSDAYSAGSGVAAIVGTNTENKSSVALATDTKITIELADSVAVSLAAEAAQYQYKIFDATTIDDASFSIASFALSEALKSDWRISGYMNGVLTIAAIPEPSAFGLLAGLGALALAGTRRRRRKA